MSQYESLHGQRVVVLFAYASIIWIRSRVSSQPPRSRTVAPLRVTHKGSEKYQSSHPSYRKPRATYIQLRDATLDRNNNSEPTTYRYDAMSGKSDFHVDISKSPRGEFLFSTWGRKNSLEESNETSEEMNDAYVENKKYPRGDLKFPTWILVFGSYIATLLSLLAIRTLSEGGAERGPSSLAFWLCGCRALRRHCAG